MLSTGMQFSFVVKHLMTHVLLQNIQAITTDLFGKKNSILPWKWVKQVCYKRLASGSWMPPLHAETWSHLNIVTIVVFFSLET